jgi:hypothetical protein
MVCADGIADHEGLKRRASRKGWLGVIGVGGVVVSEFTWTPGFDERV